MASEADTIANYIDPALQAAQWQPSNIIREHYFTEGRKLTGAVRGRRCFADYLLSNESRSLPVNKTKKSLYTQQRTCNQHLDGFDCTLKMKTVIDPNSQKIARCPFNPRSGND